MKEHLQITAVFAVLLMIIPCMVFLSAQQREKKAEESTSSQQEENSQEDEQQTVRYYLTKQDKTLELSMEEYVSIVRDAVSLLPENICIHRMTGDGNRRTLIAPLWSLDKKRVINSLKKALA